MAAPARSPNLAKRQDPAPVKAPAEEEAPASRLSWFLGWVVVPGVVFGSIFGAGLLVGAHFPDGWVAWIVRGVASLFGG